MSLTPPAPVTVTPSPHKFFDDLVTAIASIGALHAGFITHAQNTKYRFLEKWPLRLPCLTRREGRATYEIDVKPESILTPLSVGEWPTSLELRFDVVREAGDEPLEDRVAVSAPLHGIKRLIANIVQQAFIAYYERHQDDINKARGTAGPNGLPTLAFANAVRNAFAHGGTIFVKEENKIVSWGGLTYCKADNGRQLLGNDLELGDIILLMLEMDGQF